MKLAILSNVSTQYLKHSVSEFLNHEVDVVVHETAFGTWKIAARGLDEDLNNFQPDAILIFLSATACRPDDLANTKFSNDVLDAICVLKGWFEGRVFVSSIDQSDVSLHSCEARISIEKLNIELFEMSKRSELIYIDLFSLMHCESYKVFSPNKYHGIGCFSLHPKFYNQIGRRIASVIRETISRSIKMIFVDLDNTLWPGILGDEGIDSINLAPDTNALPHLNLQYLLKGMKEKGVLIGIISKNNYSTVKDFFQIRKRELILQWDDFASVKANWQPKSLNISEALSELNLTSKGVMFLDDSQFERNEVLSVLPEITVPDLPTEPYDWAKFISDLEIFHLPVVTEEDSERTKFYGLERKRLEIKQKLTHTDYLKSLNLRLTPQLVSDVNIERVIQLINKTNQFNTNGNVVDYEYMKGFIHLQDHFAWAFALQDEYSQYGIISCIFGKKCVENTLSVVGWVVSCRAFTRNVENSILQFLVGRFPSYKYISVDFTETKKNRYAQKYFEDMKFECVQSDGRDYTSYVKSSDHFLSLNTYITQNDEKLN